MTNTKKTWQIETAKDLPAEIPLFPLTGVLLLPRGELPLNIFEPRYIDMIDDALCSNRLIGIIQPRDADVKSCCGDCETYDVGCAGRITEYSETEDGRYIVTLRGLARFRVTSELPKDKTYRRAQIDWSSFEGDLQHVDCLAIDRTNLKCKLKSYFDQQNMQCCWESIEKTPDQKLMAMLAMVCPLLPSEKQALLEIQDCKKRAEMFMSMLTMAICPGSCSDKAN